MDRAEITTRVISALCELQETSGRPLPEQVGEDTCPMGGLEGFDSLNAIEVTCQLSEQLGFEVDEKLFEPSQSGVSVSIRDLVDRLCNAMEEKGDAESARSQKRR